MAVLWAASRRRPSRYWLSSPSMMKMLKSSPRPKMKVERMMLTMLNSMSSRAISPMMSTQLIAMGRLASSASSMRP